MKYLLLLLLLVVVWLLFFKGRSKPAPPRDDRKGRNERGGKPAPMLECAHCGLHIPRAEAVTDAAGRSFCGEAHRLAGPR